MAIYAQHGYGKTTKVERGLDAGDIEGVIFSPRDELPDNLATFVEQISEIAPESTRFIDTQFHASTIVNPRLGRLTEYDYFQSELTIRDLVSTANIEQIARDVLRFQNALDVTHLCSPTVSFDSFGDRWSTIALNLANASIERRARSRFDRPLIISLVIAEQAFRQQDSLDEFLDLLTDLDCAGFYIIVRRENGEYSQQIEPDILSGLLYMSYALKELNGYEVYHGYTDFVSVALHAAGCNATGCGWQFGLRKYTNRRFEPSSGGRQPRPRYSSGPLLNSILINPELNQIAARSLLDEVLTGTEFDAVLDVNPPSSANWPNETSALHHWETLWDLSIDIEAEQTPTARMDALETMIENAISLYRELDQEGVLFENNSSNAHLIQWENGIASFRARARI